MFLSTYNVCMIIYDRNKTSEKALLSSGFLDPALPVHGHPLHRLPLPVRGVLLMPGHQPWAAGRQHGERVEFRPCQIT